MKDEKKVVKIVLVDREIFVRDCAKQKGTNTI